MVFPIDCQRHRHSIGLCMLDGIEDQLADRFEEQRADVLSFRIGMRIGDDSNLDLVLVVRPVRQPVERRREP